MLQQMQRQMRGGGLQEMMKAMMQGQGGDQFDMEEMQSPFAFHWVTAFVQCSLPTDIGMMSQMGGLGGLGGLGGPEGGMPNMADMFKMMGMGGMGRGGR